MTSLGSAIFAFLAAGVYRSIEEAQAALCPDYDVVQPDARQAAVYDTLFGLYRRLYFAFGRKSSTAAVVGDVLPTLRAVAAKVRQA